MPKTVFFILSWFAFNISMANVAKWLFMYGVVCTEGRECRTYDFPLTMTSFDIAVGRVLSDIYLSIWMPNRQRMPLRQQLRDIAPLGACFAISVGLGNLSLKYIYPSLNQMIGASTPLITVAMAFACGTRYNSWTWASMPVICFGLAVCVTKEVNFHLLGASACVGAAVLRGAKSIIQARLLAGARLDPVELLAYMSPYAAVVLYAFALCVEGVEPVLMVVWWPLQAKTTGLGVVIGLLLLTALNAWFLSVANFLVTFHTSPVTLQVLGNVKTCLSIIVSVAIFKNPLTTPQCFGVGSCLIGVWIYSSKGRAIKPDAPDTKTK